MSQRKYSNQDVINWVKANGWPRSNRGSVEESRMYQVIHSRRYDHDFWLEIQQFRVKRPRGRVRGERYCSKKLIKLGLDLMDSGGVGQY